jgi:VanZ family protein
LNRSPKEIWKVWIAAGLWLALIIAESSNFGSAGHTAHILYPLLHFLFGMSPERFPVWHVVIRKSGHFIGYFMLSLLLFRAWRATLPQPHVQGWWLTWARIAWITTTLVACLDELHQAYIPTRGSSVHDVLLDSAAALTAQVIIWLWLRRGSAEQDLKYA